MTKDSIHYKKIKKHIDETYSPADFPKMMQSKEAEMFYGTIINQIDQPCVTIHDSIIVQSGKKCNVSKIIKQAFKGMHSTDHGIDVRVSCEPWYEK
jgi:hypothetical protein